MTPRCDLEYAPKPCVEMYRRASTRQGHLCNGCETGRKRTEAAGPPKEEETVDKKERVLATITRRQPCSSTPILQCCTAVKAVDLHQLTKELAAEGQIKIWTDGRKTIFTLPGAPDPFAGAVKKVAPSNDATVSSKPPRRVNRVSATPPSKKSAKTEHTVPAQRKPTGNGVYAAVIADLEVRKAAIDRALQGLRALA